jgi:thiazole/oxazole-forming peptide maturase SagD family component
VTWSSNEPVAKTVPLERLLERAVDPIVGLIKRVTELTIQPGEADVFVAMAEFHDPHAFAPQTERIDRKLFGSGAHITREGALWAAVGEAIERYAGGVYFDEDVITASFLDVAAVALDPREMIAFSDEQYDSKDFPFVRFDPKAARGWVNGFDLTNRRDILVPASTAVLGYATRTPAERLDSQYSTGLSTGSSYSSAAASAIREVIERDAFMCHWYTRMAPKRVDPEWLRNEVRPEVAALLNHRGLRLNVMDMTTDIGVPCMLAMLQRDNGQGVAVGAGCRFKPAEAAEKAIIEAYHCMCWLLDLERPGLGAVELDEIKTFEDHTRYYIQPDRFSNLAFLISGPVGRPAPPFDASTPEREVQSLCAILKDRGFRVILVDMTPEDVREVGLAVVRAIVPGLHPLSCGPGREHFDRRRLEQFCNKRGAPLPKVLNPDLHPFP